MKRLAKAISDSGYCSRRDAEKLILDSRVSVNKELVSEIVCFVNDEDEIYIDGEYISQKLIPRLFIYNKPRGEIVSHKDENGRTTIFSKFDKSLGHLISVGRLDLDSEGLILITNSGELARKLEMPENEYERIYEVKAHGSINMKAIKSLERGINIEGQKYKPCKIRFLKSNKTNHFFEVVLKEGKNREIRKMFEHINMQVSRLKRTAFHIFNLGNMKKGEFKEVEIPNDLFLV